MMAVYPSLCLRLFFLSPLSPLRHDKIRHEEQKAKQDGQAYVLDAENLKAGGPGREPPSNSSLNALWEIVEMDCRAARFSDTLCDELEEEHLLGKVKVCARVFVR